DDDAAKTPKPDEPAAKPVDFTFKVVDERGRIVPGAKATVDAERRNFARSATTDADGKAKIAARPNESNTHMVRVEAKGFVTREVRNLSTDGENEIALIRGAPLGGIVRGADGKPLANAVVEVQANEKNSSIFQDEMQLNVSVPTDAQGRWLTPALPTHGKPILVTAVHPD